MKKTTIICEVCQKEVVFEGEKPPQMKDIASKFLISPQIVIQSKGGNSKKQYRNLFENFKSFSHVCLGCGETITQKIEEVLISIFPKDQLESF